MVSEMRRSEKVRISRASGYDFPRTKSSTSRALKAEERTYLATARLPGRVSAPTVTAVISDELPALGRRGLGTSE